MLGIQCNHCPKSLADALFDPLYRISRIHAIKRISCILYRVIRGRASYWEMLEAIGKPSREVELSFNFEGIFYSRLVGGPKTAVSSCWNIQ